MAKGIIPSQPVAPEIYRSSPFEYVLTAEASQIVGSCSKPVPLTGPWMMKVGGVQTTPALPKWMSLSRQGGKLPAR